LEVARSTYIYEITTDFDDSVYVGKTKRPRERWKTHQDVVRNPLYRAMLEHGPEHFRFRVIGSYEQPANASRAEEARILRRLNDGKPVYNVQYVPKPAEDAPPRPDKSWRGTLCEANDGSFIARYKGRDGKWRSKRVPLSVTGQAMSEAERRRAALLWVEEWFTGAREGCQAAEAHGPPRENA